MRRIGSEATPSNIDDVANGEPPKAPSPMENDDLDKLEAPKEAIFHGPDVKTLPTSDLQYAKRLCEGRGGSDSDLVLAGYVIAGIPVEQRQTFVDYIKSLCEGRDGSANMIATDAQTIVQQIPVERRTQALIDYTKRLCEGRAGDAHAILLVSHQIAQIPVEECQGVIDAISNLIHDRAGDVNDILAFITARMELPFGVHVNRIDQALLGVGTTESISELTRVLLRLQPAAANPADALQVHREAAIAMKPIYDFINEQLGDTKLLSLNESEKQINDWIDNADLSLIDENAKRQMSGLLRMKKYQDALRVGFADLGGNVDGQLLLQKVVTYCTQHPEHINHFLAQCLLDAARAYDDDSGLDNVSCVTGIAERFLLGFRDLAVSSTLVGDMLRVVYEHPEYQKFWVMGNEDEKTSDRIAWINKYKGEKNKEALRTRIQADLMGLKHLLVLEAEQKGMRKDNAQLVSETDAMKSMFHIFDNIKNSPEEVRLDKIWTAIRGDST